MKTLLNFLTALLLSVILCITGLWATYKIIPLVDGDKTGTHLYTGMYDYFTKNEKNQEKFEIVKNYIMENNLESLNYHDNVGDKKVKKALKYIYSKTTCEQITRKGDDIYFTERLLDGIETGIVYSPQKVSIPNQPNFQYDAIYDYWYSYTYGMVPWDSPLHYEKIEGSFLPLIFAFIAELIFIYMILGKFKYFKKAQQNKSHIKTLFMLLLGIGCSVIAILLLYNLFMIV